MTERIPIPRDPANDYTREMAERRAEFLRERTGVTLDHVRKASFDPAVLPDPALLEVFFGTHDPTTKDRQGHDVGTQYRSAVFAHDAEQEAAGLAPDAQAGETPATTALSSNGRNGRTRGFGCTISRRRL